MFPYCLFSSSCFSLMTNYYKLNVPYLLNMIKHANHLSQSLASHLSSEFFCWYFIKPFNVSNSFWYHLQKFVMSLWKSVIWFWIFSLFYCGSICISKWLFCLMSRSYIWSCRSGICVEEHCWCPWVLWGIKHGEAASWTGNIEYNPRIQANISQMRFSFLCCVCPDIYFKNLLWMLETDKVYVQYMGIFWGRIIWRLWNYLMNNKNSFREIYPAVCGLSVIITQRLPQFIVVLLLMM